MRARLSQLSMPACGQLCHSLDAAGLWEFGGKTSGVRFSMTAVSDFQECFVSVPPTALLQ